jgi:hypothetical protein
MIGRHNLKIGESAYYLIVAFYGLAFLFRQYAHLQDYAQWVYSGVILNGKLLGLSLPAYSCRLYPVPNSSTTFLIAALSLIVKAALAAKLLVVLYLVLFAWIVMAINKQLQAGQHVQKSLIILSTIIISSSFWNGYMNYQLALLLFAGFYLIRLKGRDSLFITTIFGIAIFFSHAAVFAVFFIYVFLCHFSLKNPDRRLFALLPPSVLTLWYLYGNFLRGGEGEGMALTSPVGAGVVNFVMYKAYTYLKAGPFQNFILPSKQSYLEGCDGVYFLFIFISALFLVLLFLNIAHGLYGKLTGKSKFDRDLVFFAIVFLSYLIFPPKLLNVVNIGERFLMIGLMFLLFRVTFNRRLLCILTVISVMFTAYNIVFLSTGDQAGAGRVQSDTSSVPENGRLSKEFQSLYTRTKHKYLNHRIFDGADHYRAIVEDDFTKGVFPTGIIIYHNDNP